LVVQQAQKLNAIRGSVGISVAVLRINNANSSLTIWLKKWNYE